MRKGITPVVAMILLLLMTVATAGGAFVWFSGIMEQSQEEATQQLNTDLTVKDIECKEKEITISISNTGDREVDGSEADIFLYDASDNLVSQQKEVSLSGFDAPGSFSSNTIQFPDSAFAEGGRTKVEVVLSNSDHTVSGICNSRILQSGVKLTTRDTRDCGLPDERSTDSYDQLLDSWKDCGPENDYGTDYMENIDISENPFGNDEHYFWLFEGYIHAPESGTYEFSSYSDDASYLFIDSKTVVEIPGCCTRDYGNIDLDQGIHSIRLLGVEDGGGDYQEVGWTKPSDSSHTDVIPADRYFSQR